MVANLSSSPWFAYSPRTFLLHEHVLQVAGGCCRRCRFSNYLVSDDSAPPIYIPSAEEEEKKNWREWWKNCERCANKPINYNFRFEKILTPFRPIHAYLGVKNESTGVKWRRKREKNANEEEKRRRGEKRWKVICPHQLYRTPYPILGNEEAEGDGAEEIGEVARGEGGEVEKKM